MILLFAVANLSAFQAAAYSTFAPTLEAPTESPLGTTFVGTEAPFLRSN